MNKVFKMLQESYGSAPQRNGFDLSRRNIFSIKAGMKVPVFTLETVPNDYHEIRPVDIIRTMPFNEANFVRMKQHIDFYWCPMTLFQSNFNEVIQQTTDPVNSLLASDKVKYFPTFPMFDLVGALVYACARRFGFAQSVVDEFFSQFTGFVGDGSYLKMFCDNPETTPVSKDMFGNYIFEGTIRLLDMLGYGNFLWLLSEDVYQGLADGQASELITNLPLFYGKSVNLYRFAAYQSVYQNYGINTIFDKLDIYSYNFDDVVRNGNSSDSWYNVRYSQTDFVANLRSIFTLRYSQWKKDVFTSLYPDSQFGSISVVSNNFVLGDSIGSVVPSGNFGLYINPDDGSNLAIRTSSGGSTPSRSFSSSFSILDLRRAEALQGWKEDMMRSGFRSRTRQRSQFGVSPNFDMHNMPVPLGSVTADIQKDVVTGTSGNEFAQQASTGISTMGNDVIKFDGRESNDFGIIIGIMSILPDADYDSYGLDIHNMKSEPFDFYTPAFANIGLQALPKEYLNFSLPQYFVDSSNILGYTPRYIEYKQAYDKVHGEFASVAGVDGQSFRPGQFRQFVTSRLDLERFGLSSIASLYVNPAVLNDVFFLDADSSQSTDQFHVNAFFEVKSVRPISVTGLPRW